MLYLEDYLEMIEQLPMELRERFTEMREMDLQVENSVDTLDDKVKKFFEAAKKLKPDSKQQQYETIRKDYYKLLDSADEKVQIANQVYDTVERYLRKLDQEVSRFKMELEADHAGITEILERRSLESDGSQKMQSGKAKSDKRKHTLENHTDKRVNADKLLSTIATNAAQEVAPPRGGSLGGNSNSVVNSRESSSGSSSSSLPYSLDNVGSSSAIAMAAAQAVSNTLQMQQGRRTASMKASYEAIKSGGYSGLGTLSSRDFTYGANASTSEGAPSSSNKSSSRHKNKKHKSSSSSSSQQLQQQMQQQQQQPPGGDLMMLIDPLTEQPIDDTSQSSYEWTYDPNEPRYCVCNQVSYGEMVGCDNAKCPIEWFHYACVGITNPPKGKWYCPQCASAMKRREKKEPPSVHKTK